MRVDPSLALDKCLLELDVTAGIDAGNDSPPEIYGSDDVALDACHRPVSFVNPDAALQTRKNFSDHRRRMKRRIRLEIDNHLRRGRTWRLWLSRRIGIESCLRQELD